jgi:hypothetical protein
MNLGLASALRGLPALAGVMLGVYLYAIPFKGATGLPMVAMIVLVLLLVIANRMFNQRPRLGAALLEPWTLASVALVATFTGLVLWLTVNLEALLGLPPTQAKAVSGALIGAFTTYAATAWIKDIQEANGLFVTSGQAQLHFKNFATHHGLVGDSVALELCQEETVTTKDGKVEGWGWKARRQRARLLQQFLDGGKKPLPRA